MRRRSCGATNELTGGNASVATWSVAVIDARPILITLGVAMLGNRNDGPMMFGQTSRFVVEQLAHRHMELT